MLVLSMQFGRYVCGVLSMWWEEVCERQAVGVVEKRRKEGESSAFVSWAASAGVAECQSQPWY
jgi:hypothetical protein